MVLQNREMHLGESRWVSGAECAAGIAAGGRGLSCEACAFGQELLAARGDPVGQGGGGLARPGTAGVGRGLHRTRSRSSHPGQTG